MRVWFGNAVLLVIISVATTLVLSNEWTKPFVSKRKTDLKSHAEKVVKFWEDKVLKDPYSFTLRKKLGSAKMELARISGNESLFIQAEELLKDAVQYAPGKEIDAELAFLSATAIMSRHGFSEALTLLRPVKAQGESKLLLLVGEGDALCGLGEYKECLSKFEEARKLKPGFDTQVRVAQVEESLGNFEKAIELLLSARALVPSFKPDREVWLLVRIASIYIKQRKLDRAEEILSEALTLDPNYYLAQEHLAEVYELREEYEQAEPLLRQAIATKRDPHLLVRLAKCLEQLPKTKTNVVEESQNLRAEALQILRKGVTTLPAAHSRDLAELILEQAEISEVEKVELRQLTATDLAFRPYDTRSNFIAARVFRLLGDEALSKKYLSVAMQYGHGDPQIAVFYNASSN